MSFFQSDQVCISISCCHRGPKTFFWISGLLIPIGTDSKVGWIEPQLTIRSRSRYLYCAVERTIVASGVALKTRFSRAIRAIEMLCQLRVGICRREPRRTHQKIVLARCRFLPAFSDSPYRETSLRRWTPFQLLRDPCCRVFLSSHDPFDRCFAELKGREV